MVISEQQNISEFWWLSQEEAVKYKYVYFCHQEPYSDEPNSEKDPESASRFFSVDKGGELSNSVEYFSLDFINFWRKKCANINIFRGFGLSSSEHDNEKLFGPFLIDIDREEGGFSKGYEQNLDEALEDTRRIVNEYLHKYKKEDFRIFFTGHKGFNIKVHPQALGIASVKNRWQAFENKIADINNTFGTSFVDKIHEEIRLHDSINSWIKNDGQNTHRMKFELSINELFNLNTNEICVKSERLALSYLGN